MRSAVARLLAAFAFVAGLPAFAHGQASPASAPVSLPAALQLVDSVAGWRRTAMQDLGAPEHGVVSQFRPAAATEATAGSFATLYLFARDAEQRGLPADSVLAIGIAAFRAVLEIQRGEGKIGSYQIPVEKADSITMHGRTYPGRMLVYVYRRGDEVGVSVFQLHVVDEALVKVRLTMTPAQFRESRLMSLPRQLAVAAIRAPVAAAQDAASRP